MVRRSFRFLLALSFAMVGLAAAVHAETKAEFDAQLAPYVSDPGIRDFLAREAVAAGVRKIHFLSADQTRSTCGPDSYGCATYTKGAGGGDVYLNTGRSGGTGVMNITHEVAHIWAFRNNCNAHGDLYLEYLMAMAQRFEAEFPGVAWGKSDPTASVEDKYIRYAMERSQCKTAATPDLGLQISRVEVQVPQALEQDLVGKVSIVVRRIAKGTKKMETFLETDLGLISPGLFAVDLTAPDMARQVAKGELLCINVGKGFYIDMGADQGKPIGVCYVHLGRLTEGPGAWIAAPDANGVLVARLPGIKRK